MLHRKRDRLDFWIHFTCGFLFFGLLNLLFLFQYVDSLGPSLSVSIWLGGTAFFAILVGFKGDDMWVWLAQYLRDITQWFHR